MATADKDKAARKPAANEREAAKGTGGENKHAEMHPGTNRLDMRNEIEQGREATEMVEIPEPGLETGGWRLYGKVYHAGETKIPRALAISLGYLGKDNGRPPSDKSREGPKAEGGPDPKAALEEQEKQRAAAGNPSAGGAGGASSSRK